MFLLSATLQLYVEGTIDDAELVTNVVSVSVFRTNSSMRIFAPILQLFWWFNEMDEVLVLAFMLCMFHTDGACFLFFMVMVFSV